MQRAFEIVVSLLGLIVLSPLFAAISLVIKLSDGGPVFYRARRVGKDERFFDLFKFRTMVPNADSIGPTITARDDNRITPLGHILRRSKLDELPQLINVVIGDMSLVGARPEDPSFVESYTPEQRRILAYRPGITSPVSLYLRNEEALFTEGDWVKEYSDRVLPHKLENELEYLRHRTILTDTRVILMTVLTLVFLNRRVCRIVLKARNRHVFAMDVLFALFLPGLALAIRMDGFDSIRAYAFPLFLYTGLALIWKLAIFWGAGLYDRFWRYASVYEAAFITLAVSLSGIVGLIVFFGMLVPLTLIRPDFPRSIPLFDAVFTAIQVGGVRFAIRLAFEINEGAKATALKKNVVVVGAGVAGSIVVKEMRTNPQLGLKAVAFVDDDPQKQGMRLHGVPVRGSLHELPEVLNAVRAREVIIAMPQAPGEVIRRVVEVCKRMGVESKTIPGLFELLEGSAKVTEVRDVEVEDLRRRGVPEQPTEDLSALIRGKCVMVTGAGGSLGSELCRQISMFEPIDLLLVGQGEKEISEIAAELRDDLERTSRVVGVHPIIADIRDHERMENIFRTHRPGLVYHAAAKTNVGLMEANVPEAVTTNVLGTQVLVDLSERHGVERFIMASPGEAVNPICVVGVTKRIAELIVHDAAKRTARPFVTIRFGGVLGGRGNLIQTMRKEIAKGGPVRISHPEAKHAFMTMQEAVHLMLQASAVARGGGLYVLDMGEPTTILELARDLVRLSGRVKPENVQFVFSGLNPGEKLVEELFYGIERPEPSGHERILVCRGAGWLDQRRANGGNPEEGWLRDQVERLIAAVRLEEMRDITKLFREIVPEYLPMHGTEEVGDSAGNKEPELPFRQALS